MTVNFALEPRTIRCLRQPKEELPELSFPIAPADIPYDVSFNILRETTDNESDLVDLFDGVTEAEAMAWESGKNIARYQHLIFRTGTFRP